MEAILRRELIEIACSNGVSDPEILRDILLPPGANRFCSRQAWGKQVAYSTQLESKFDRAITAREKVKSRLIGELDPREWELPPKPRWMRWHTYERLAEKYRFHQGTIDQCFADFVA